MYPRDTITYTETVSGAVSKVIVGTSTNTIVGNRIHQTSDTFETFLSCGSTTLAHSYNSDFPMQEMNYVCVNAPILLNKTGIASNNSFYSISYVPRNRIIRPDPPESGLSYQEILLFNCMMLGLALMVLWRLIFRQPKK